MTPDHSIVNIFDAPLVTVGVALAVVVVLWGSLAFVGWLVTLPGDDAAAKPEHLSPRDWDRVGATSQTPGRLEERARLEAAVRLGDGQRR